MNTPRPRTLAIIQARMSSSRLPGKVLLPIGGLPAIRFMAERVRRAACVDAVCIATSVASSDDPLAAALAGSGVHVHRGNLEDVLDRFVGAARAHAAEIVIRLTGDCPLIDPWLIDQVVERLIGQGADYASNVDPPTFPDGLDVEAFTAAALERAAAEARMVSEREHVTPYIRSASGFRRTAVSGALDMSALRWTVDYPDDYDLITRMVGAVAGDPLAADRFDYLRAYEEIGAPGAAHARNEGYAKSLADDRPVTD